jgi:hypothetical protein
MNIVQGWGFVGGADSADGEKKRKREPIPAFKPRERKPAAAADAKPAAEGREPKVARTDGASDKRASVFERLHSGDGKVRCIIAAPVPQLQHACKHLCANMGRQV